MIKDLKNLFVPYAQSLQLKELGFDEPCFGYYQGGTNNLIIEQIIKSQGDGNWCLSPTFSQAFRWFRDKHNLLNIIDCYISTPLEWFIRIDKISNDSLEYKNDITEESEDKVYLTYEEAEIACLGELIKIIKNKQ
jgi:hypothetical protein